MYSQHQASISCFASSRSLNQWVFRHSARQKESPRHLFFQLDRERNRCGGNASNNVYIADYGNNRVLKVTLPGGSFAPYKSHRSQSRWTVSFKRVIHNLPFHSSAETLLDGDLLNDDRQCKCLG